MIIYSRFNCKHYCVDSKFEQESHRNTRRMNKLRFDSDWLEERLKLFKAFTLPSVQSQTNKKFKWIGIVHPDSPSWFIKELQGIKPLKLKLCELDIEAKESDNISVNLDTDDAIARDFIAQAYKIKFKGEFLFLRGMRYRIYTDCWTNTKTKNSHFNIVNHPYLTVLDFSHGQSQLKKKIIDIKRPMWLEVIHEKNISNRLKTAKADQNLGRSAAIKHFNINELKRTPKSS